MTDRKKDIVILYYYHNDVSVTESNFETGLRI